MTKTLDSLEMANFRCERKCVGKMPLVYSFFKKEMAKRIESHMASSHMVNGCCFDWPPVKTYASD